MTTVLESAYPLQWPLDRPRTKYPTNSRFKVAKTASIARMRDELLSELHRYKARDIVLSSNLKLRIDGFPLSGQRQPDDCGVAVYFTDRSKRRICFACDKWKSVEENIYSIAMTIGAIRGIARWGMQEAVDAAFTGFQALPPPSTNGSMTLEDAVLFLAIHGVVPKDYIYESRAQYENAARKAAMKLHPDRGGDAEEFKKLERAKSLIEEQLWR